MGVTHLWKMLEKAERPAELDECAGQVVAVDVSIWIHQLLHGIRDGDKSPNAYLVGIFHRVCKLLYHRIKPVFVFDGSAPTLKKRALVSLRKAPRLHLSSLSI
jgi:DNA excision repair protein ERCC-5